MKIPKGQINFFMGRIHVSSTEKEVIEEIAPRCANKGFTQKFIESCVDYALKVHQK